jgi:hypothetical protein
MKKKIIVGVLLVAVLTISNKTIAQAYAADPCHDYRHGMDDNHIHYAANYSLGFNNPILQITPNSPIVVGQDEERRGVTIKIKLESYPGQVDNWRFSGYQHKYSNCIYPYDGLDLVPCTTGKGTKMYQRDEGPDMSKPICTLDLKNPISVHRRIDLSTLHVWLEPDRNTKDWLGWGGGTGGSTGKNPLRYIYPESWALTKFNGEQKLCEGSRCDLSEFAYDYLKADPNLSLIPSRTLMKIDGSWVDTIPEMGSPVLGLWGGFSLDLGWIFHVGLSDPCDCLIDKKHVDRNVGYFKSTQDIYNDPNGKDAYGQCDPINACGITEGDNPPGMVTNIELLLDKVPMDLPGTWMVGIYFQVQNATDDTGDPVPYEKIDFKFRTFGLTSPIYTDHRELFTFSVYMLMTTPCNDQDKLGCTQ